MGESFASTLWLRFKEPPFSFLGKGKLRFLRFLNWSTTISQIFLPLSCQISCIHWLQEELSYRMRMMISTPWNLMIIVKHAITTRMFVFAIFNSLQSIFCKNWFYNAYHALCYVNTWPLTLQSIIHKWTIMNSVWFAGIISKVIKHFSVRTVGVENQSNQSM